MTTILRQYLKKQDGIRVEYYFPNGATVDQKKLLDSIIEKTEYHYEYFYDWFTRKPIAIESETIKGMLK